MANATASKPDKAPKPKKTPRQPPADTVWLRYHPWMEGVVGHAASWVVHLFAVGIVLLFVMAYAFGWIKNNKPIPVESVQLADAGGGGDPNAANKTAVPNMVLPEGVHTDQNQTGDPNNAAPPVEKVYLPPNLAAKLDQGFQVPDQPGGATTTAASDLSKAIDDKLHQYSSRSQGAGGVGAGGGNGPGAGVGTGPGTAPGVKGGDLTEAEEEDQRWSINLLTRDGQDYLRQLAAMGVLIAIPAGRDSYVVVDLKKKPLQFEEKTIDDLIQLKKTRFKLTDSKPDSVASLLKATGYPGRAPFFDGYFPNEMQPELKQVELAYKHMTEEQIHGYNTTFRIVFDSNGDHRITVLEQTPRTDLK
ncbi:MAG TPA: hypothetical protein VMS17_21345 [Gemmataceae bacterium]|nr:hypothetical protein [Gemmataceae bacterium]